MNSRRLGIFLAAAAVILGCRVWLAVDLPLTDTTEARYSEMARKMVETGNWLMPQHDYGVPFMGKPPLAMWLPAVSIQLMGPNGFAPRVPVLLICVGFLFFLYRWIRRELGEDAAATAVLVLMASMLFFFSMAAVMTDLILVASVDIALLLFWRRMHEDSRRTEWAFFALIGTGLLTKGPLAAFLILVPIAIWALLCRRLVDVWRRIGWFRGSLITALVAAPWYLAAEWKYPGFLRYFLIGENIERFLVSDWSGDLYGAVHELPHGSIWIFLAFAALPWSLIGFVTLIRKRSAFRPNWRRRRDLAIFMLAAAGVPMLLFTLAQNVLFPYALPALVPGVIAALALLGDSVASAAFVRNTAITAAATALFYVIGARLVDERIERQSQLWVIDAVASDFGAPLDSLYYWQLRHYSADYYSQGKVRVIDQLTELRRLMADVRPAYFVMMDEQFDMLPEDMRQSLQQLGKLEFEAIYTPADTGRGAGI